MRMRTLAIDYRRAGHPFPAQHEDALTAWRCAGRVLRPRIAVGGDAPARLTLSLHQPLRGGRPLPGCAWLVSPWTDLTMSGDAFATKDAVDHPQKLSRERGPTFPTMDRRDPLICAFVATSEFPPMRFRSARPGAAVGRGAAPERDRQCRCAAEIWRRYPRLAVWNAADLKRRRALAAAAGHRARMLRRRPAAAYFLRC
jgi:acetyl esterase/lipase